MGRLNDPRQPWQRQGARQGRRAMGSNSRGHFVVSPTPFSKALYDDCGLGATKNAKLAFFHGDLPGTQDAAGEAAQLYVEPCPQGCHQSARARTSRSLLHWSSL